MDRHNTHSTLMASRSPSPGTMSAGFDVFKSAGSHFPRVSGGYLYQFFLPGRRVMPPRVGGPMEVREAHLSLNPRLGLPGPGALNSAAEFR